MGGKKLDFYFKIILRLRKKEIVKGISSMCEDMKHILMLDYDSISYELVIKELKMVQERFKLTPFYLFTTKCDDEGVGNYHAICLTKMTPSEVIRIQQETHCDSNYITMPIRNKYRSWVIRVSEKAGRSSPRYVGIVGNLDYLNNEISNAHLGWLTIWDKVEHIGYTNLDGYSRVGGQEYVTLNV